TNAGQGCNRKARLAFPPPPRASPPPRGPPSAHARKLPRHILVTVGPCRHITDHRIQHLDSEALYFGFGSSSDVDPQIFERCKRCVCGTAALQVRALHRDHTHNRNSTRQYSDSLSFMKLNPQRMLPPGSHLAQTEVTVSSNLRDCKRGSIDATRNYASRGAATLMQDEIAKRVAVPSQHRIQGLLCSKVL